jgi:hypothetical protein
MRIGLWNIDHPEALHKPGTAAYSRYHAVSRYLNRQACDVFVITEANAAIRLPGYQAEFSDESPFLNRSRIYERPNRYHQVAIYSRVHVKPLEIAEPVNGLLCRMIWHDRPLLLYGNVVTIKDQFSKNSDKKYGDRLREQLDAINQLTSSRTLVAGDFNLRLGWRERSHRQVKELVYRRGLAWPTEARRDTVQHVIHSQEISVKVSLDASVRHTDGRKGGLSDHPFVLIELQ